MSIIVICLNGSESPKKLNRNVVVDKLKNLNTNYKRLSADDICRQSFQKDCI